MELFLDSIIYPMGWFIGPNDLIKRQIYLKFRHWGPRAASDTRVAWVVSRVAIRANEAKPFTASKLIYGDGWILNTGIPYYGSFACEL